MARNVTDPHVVFVPLDEPALDPDFDVHLRVAWRRGGVNPAVRTVLDEMRTLDDAAAD